MLVSEKTRREKKSKVKERARERVATARASKEVLRRDLDIVQS